MSGPAHCCPALSELLFAWPPPAGHEAVRPLLISSPVYELPVTVVANLAAGQRPGHSLALPTGMTPQQRSHSAAHGKVEHHVRWPVISTCM